MKDMKVGVHVTARDAAGLVDGIVAAEKAGVDVAWMTSGGVAPDPLAVFAAAAMRTERILLGTCIIPTFPRHPLAVVQGAVTVDSLAPGRLRVGVGPSHKPTIEGSFGIPFVRPLEHLREYLTVLRAALYEGKVDFEGKRITAKAQLAGPTGVKVMASALRHNGFKVCGELADGAISWMCPLPYLRDVAVPAIAEGAAAAGREVPPLVAHVPVMVTEDKDALYAGAQKQVSFYARVPYYSQMFQDAGFPEASTAEFSNRMADAIVVNGSADTVKDRLLTLQAEYGVGELLAMPILAPGDERASLQRVLEVLGELAAE